MDEKREKELAKRLGDHLDGLAVDEMDDPELAESIEMAYAISGALGEGPDLKPEFDTLLRARLVREAGRAEPAGAGAAVPAARPAAAPRRTRIWAAVAAALLVLVVSVAVVRDMRIEAHKMKLVEKYDKMYVPYSERADIGERGYRVEPFSDAHREEINRIRRETLINKTGDYYRNYRTERRYRL